MRRGDTRCKKHAPVTGGLVRAGGIIPMILQHALA
jgi:hypothetical protein